MDSQLTFLAKHQKDGWWPYFAGKDQSVEATAWCSIACRKNKTCAEAAVNYFLKTQNPDGGWSTEAGAGESDWTTALALLALNALKANLDDAALTSRLENSSKHGYEFLSTARAELYSAASRIALMMFKGADYSYPHGWPWMKDTFHWVEPTAYSILALKLLQPQSASTEALLKQASSYLIEVSCEEGGWNYGCRKVLGQALRAIPMTTAVALLALQDRADHDIVRKGMEYLKKPGVDKDTALARAWTSLALHACGEKPPATKPAKASADLDAHLSLTVSAISLIADGITSDGNPFKIGA